MNTPPPAPNSPPTPQQYAHGVNKPTFAKNAAKVDAKEKELAEAKAAAKVLFAPPYIPCLPSHSPFCFETGDASVGTRREDNILV